jgi:catechol 2,3-dioxygenase-like lactoylglutathione lyase family enzyme
MKIVGPDALLFGVDNIPEGAKFLTDYGLQPVDVGAGGGRFQALDGTYVELREKADPSLPPPMGPASKLRKTLYGVADSETLRAVAEELAKDREVRQLDDGSIETMDDMGFVLGFQRTVRRKFNAPPERVNSPGSAPQRAVNHVAANENAVIVPRTLSHVVYFVPDAVKAEKFYVERLKFRCTDRFINTGPFLRPAASEDHHTLFMIQTPPHMKGCEHFTFHVAGPTEVLQAGNRLVNKGYTSFWGPGRHKFGSNWFWYFDSPFNCHIEYDADMDLHDDTWTAREAPINADNSQLFLFQQRAKWVPGGPPGKVAVTEIDRH